MREGRSRKVRVEEGVVVTTAKQCMTRLLPLTHPLTPPTLANVVHSKGEPKEA